jgi:hypothetical protein
MDGDFRADLAEVGGYARGPRGGQCLQIGAGRNHEIAFAIDLDVAEGLARRLIQPDLLAIEELDPGPVVLAGALDITVEIVAKPEQHVAARIFRDRPALRIAVQPGLKGWVDQLADGGRVEITGCLRLGHTHLLKRWRLFYFRSRRVKRRIAGPTG